jgi:Ctr copper transporter family
MLFFVLIMGVSAVEYNCDGVTINQNWNVPILSQKMGNELSAKLCVFAKGHTFLLKQQYGNGSTVLFPDCESIDRMVDPLLGFFWPHYAFDRIKPQDSDDVSNPSLMDKQNKCREPYTWYQSNEVIKEFEFISDGGLLQAYEMSFILPMKTEDLVIISRSNLYLPPNQKYYIRSYILQNKNESSEFCNNINMAMVMYMKGFYISSMNSQFLPCLNYYFRSWVLKDGGHFTGAMFYSFLLALLTQGLSATRAVVARHVASKRRRRFLVIFIYTLQQLLGYLIMLVAMMYSLELLLSVVLGLSLGNLVFVRSYRKAAPESGV